MKKLLGIILILTLNSCFFYKKDGIEMKIKNDSSEPITNVEFTTTEKLDVIKIERIEPNESATEFLSMRKNKSDGAYSLTFTRASGKNEISGGGYYTNGGSLDHWVDFIIENDTTIVKFDAPIY
ncbi:hypothetical protein [Maribacter arenosus]|uniref:Uncharacterized protein n=1 Tax=Maribacter arenosus TaxID=1854708 RepID=A0ABR7VEL0_9FLAO|nr:hypothetical protein [Maribacter arenosus]MBD0852079.1 hypothetical protein [Maribacter arenosus]